MDLFYVVEVSGNRLFFDHRRKPTHYKKGIAEETEISDRRLVQENILSASDWDEALAAFSIEQRKSAKAWVYTTQTQPDSCTEPQEPKSIT